MIYFTPLLLLLTSVYAAASVDKACTQSALKGLNVDTASREQCCYWVAYNEPDNYQAICKDVGEACLASVTDERTFPNKLQKCCKLVEEGKISASIGSKYCFSTSTSNEPTSNTPSSKAPTLGEGDCSFSKSNRKACGDGQMCFVPETGLENANGSCKPAAGVKEGEFCFEQEKDGPRCGPGLVCTIVNFIMAPPSGVYLGVCTKKPCDLANNQDCGDAGFMCAVAGTSSSGVCEPIKAVEENKPCYKGHKEGPQCAKGLVCESIKYAIRPKDGYIPARCVARKTCSFDKRSLVRCNTPGLMCLTEEMSSSGVCVRARPVTFGEPCNHDDSEEGAKCAEGLTCVKVQFIRAPDDGFYPGTCRNSSRASSDARSDVSTPLSGLRGNASQPGDSTASNGTSNNGTNGTNSTNQ